MYGIWTRLLWHTNPDFCAIWTNFWGDRSGLQYVEHLGTVSVRGLRADLREGDEDSNFSAFRVWPFSESPEPLHWIAFPVKILTKPPIHWIAFPLFTENPFFSLKSASSHPLPQKSAPSDCCKENQQCANWRKVYHWGRNYYIINSKPIL